MTARRSTAPLTGLLGLLAAGVITVVLAACSGGGGSSTPTASGADLYAANCARCHGDDGTGGSAPSLTNIATTFPNIDDQITFVGNGGGGMPRFKGMISDADIRAVTEYTRETFR